MLRSQINPNGLSSTYRFEYVTQAAWEAGGFAGAAFAPASGSAALGSGAEPVPVFQHLAGLSPVTTYRYRVRATNGAVVFGSERSLTTEVASNASNLLDGRGWELVSPADKEAARSPSRKRCSAAVSSRRRPVAPRSPTAPPSPSPAAKERQRLASTSPAAVQPVGRPRTSPPRRSRVPMATNPTVSPIGSSPAISPAPYSPTECAAATSAPAARSPPRRCRARGAGRLPQLLPARRRRLQALVTAANAPALVLAPEEFELAFAGATPDLAHVVLSTCAQLTADATEVPAAGGCNEGEQNLYEWSRRQPTAAQPAAGAISRHPRGSARRVRWRDLQRRVAHLLQRAGRRRPLSEPGRRLDQAATGNHRWRRQLPDRLHRRPHRLLHQGWQPLSL